ncbi:MAG: hypothetical protein ACTTI5_06145 [Treponema sp.]
MIYEYIRVSTDKQTCKNQKLASREYCKAAFIRRNRLLGRSKLSPARELGVTWATLNNFMKRNNIN